MKIQPVKKSLGLVLTISALSGLATVRAPATSFRDDEASGAVSYQVIAIDADGLESAPAELAAGAPDGGARQTAAPPAVAAPER